MAHKPARVSKLAVLALAGVAQSAYTWPSKFDVLEDMIAMQSGVIRPGFTDLVVPCGFGSNRPGVQNSAEWLRTAFHDMATHDAAAGTGGLDASIMYEYDREENKGAAFEHTLTDLFEFVSPDVSAADLIALGLVASVASCGGPKIPFRAGRVDAREAGPTGVPQHTDPTDKMVAAFARMGFTRQEMIGLVACGHSVGQVHSADFPDVVGGDPGPSNTAAFDRTKAQFDAAVVTEYLNNDGVNPLVFGKNETANADKRVFGADGTNATMRALADPAAFSSTCGALLARMIDTVPRGVRLSEPIELQEVKPYVDKLDVAAAAPATLAFEGRVRVRTTGKDAETVTVSLDVADRAGKRSAVPATRMRLRGGQSQGFFGEEFTWFQFAAALDAGAGLKDFRINLVNATDNSTKTFTNGKCAARAYPVQSELLFLQADSCLNTEVVNGNMTLRLTAAVRDTAAAAPVVNLAHKVQLLKTVRPRLDMEVVAMKPLGTTRGPYSLYSAEMQLEAQGWSTSFRISMPGAKGDIATALFRTSSLSQNC